jgi:hypothetical protein
MVEAMRAHYLLRPEDRQNPYACLLNVACGIVADDGDGLVGERSHWGTDNRKLEALGLTEEQLDEAAQRGGEAFAEFAKRYVPPVPATAVAKPKSGLTRSIWK